MVSSAMTFPPKVYVTEDYHDFRAVEKILRWAGYAGVSHREVPNESGRYVAVFYSDSEAAEPLIADLRKQLASGTPPLLDLSAA